MLQHNDKYLYFPYEYDGGLDSKTYDLILLIRVALSLGRIPIIKEARTSFTHRLDDIEQDVSIVILLQKVDKKSWWSAYIIKRTKINYYQ